MTATFAKRVNQVGEVLESFRMIIDTDPQGQARPRKLVNRGFAQRADPLAGDVQRPRSSFINGIKHLPVRAEIV